MADVNRVMFRTGTKEQYKNLQFKDPNILYFISDGTTAELYKGENLYGVGHVATEYVAGLMSAEDKQALKSLIESGGSTADFPSYSIVKLPEPESDSVASYRLEKTVGGSSEYVGATINIPVDRVLTEGSLKYVENPNVPYPDAIVGDPYLDLILNNDDASHIYIPVKGLVDTVGAGNGISVVSNIVSVKLDENNTNGLKVTDAGLGLDLATKKFAGAMSASDKQVLDMLATRFSDKNYEVVDSTNPKPVVSYNEDEIRILFSKDTQFQSQQVGQGGDSSRYYTNFIAYAPEGAVKFREFADSKITVMPQDTPKENFENNSSAGTDTFGRKYTNVWLPVAVFSDGAWTYYGAKSTNSHYIGWYYGVEWYDENDMLIASDLIRINLSNEDCHASPTPYYMNDYASTAELNEALEWGVIE